MKEFIQIGCEKLLKEVKPSKLTDQVEFVYYKYLLENLTKDEVKKFPVHKDATASVIQNLIRIMGYKDLDSLKYSNLLDSSAWYDTYSFILNK